MEGPKQCSQCGAIEPRFTCSKCDMPRYCNAECQHKHWPAHKKTCAAPVPTTATTYDASVLCGRMHAHLAALSDADRTQLFTLASAQRDVYALCFRCDSYAEYEQFLKGQTRCNYLHTHRARELAGIAPLSVMGKRPDQLVILVEMKQAEGPLYASLAFAYSRRAKDDPIVMTMN